MFSATSREVSHAEEGSIIFTNVLQGHETVVLVCCTTEREPDIICMQKRRYTNVLFVMHWKAVKVRDCQTVDATPTQL